MTPKPSFLDDIKDQPDLVKRLVGVYGDRLQDRLQEAAGLINSKSMLVIVGMGSSLFAGELLSQRLNGAGLRAITYDASELFHYQRGILNDDDVVLLAISQSGESAEPCLVAEARSKSMPLICITNNKESRLGRISDTVLPLLAGHEEGTTAKTFVATMVVLHLLADAVLGERLLSSSHADKLARYMKELTRTLRDEVYGFIDRFGDFETLAFTGRGPGLVSAMQGALITQEMTQIPATGLSAGQFRHGPIEAAGSHLLMVIFAPAGRTTELLVRLAQDTAGFGSPTWLITDTVVQVPSTENLFVSRLPHVEEELSPLLSILAPELLGVALAKRKGLEPGRLQRISKVTDFE
ncbi:MAG: SIS domain-containing protein [Firmicutes bacterium]|nr:SIS domain-containing protein [Bacillota bacterium]